MPEREKGNLVYLMEFLAIGFVLGAISAQSLDIKRLKKLKFCFSLDNHVGYWRSADSHKHQRDRIIPLNKMSPRVPEVNECRPTRSENPPPKMAF